MTEHSEGFASYEDIKTFLANAKTDFEERVSHLERRFPREMFPEFDSLRRHLQQISRSWQGVRHAMEERRWNLILEFTTGEEMALKEKLSEIETFSPQGRWEVMDRVKAEISAASELCHELAEAARRSLEALNSEDSQAPASAPTPAPETGEQPDDEGDSLAAAE